MALATSPLRYPGGKTALFDMTVEVLRLNNLECGHYAEPYAGGAGLALALLYAGHVSDIHINDIDPSIWSFWQSVLNDTDALLKRIADTPVTVDEWRRQREVYLQEDSTDPLSLGFAAFFLNRTNRSGIIKGAGVIGGLKQNGNYKIDCRFNRVDLSKRIMRVAKYSDRVHLTNLDALKFLRKCKKLKSDVLMFIDPPYFCKGSDLYTSFYRREDHAALASLVIEMSMPWMMTYDDADEIRQLYKRRRQFSFDINYSLQEKRLGKELLIASKGLKLPNQIRDRQVSRPQYRAA